MSRSSLVLSPVMFSLLAACAGSPIAVARMTPEQITAVSNKDLCFAYDSGQDQTPAVREEVTRRRLDWSRVLLQAGIEPRGAARAGLGNIAGGGGVKITNNPNPQCEGIQVKGAEARQFGAVGVVGLYIFIENVSGKRKSVTLDIIYFIEGKRGLALNIPSAEHWEEAGPLVMRADQRSLAFPVKSQKSPRDKIVAINVLKCE